MDIFGLGGEYDSDRKMDDLRLLYRAYVTSSLSGGRMAENKVNTCVYAPIQIAHGLSEENRN